MASKLIEVFPKAGGQFQIELDASSGSYFVAAEFFVDQPEFIEYSKEFDMPMTTKFLNTVKVLNWPASGLQIDEVFPEMPLLTSGLSVGLELQRKGERLEDLEKHLPEYLDKSKISRKRDLGDSII